MFKVKIVSSNFFSKNLFLQNLKTIFNLTFAQVSFTVVNNVNNHALESKVRTIVVCFKLCLIVEKKFSNFAKTVITLKLKIKLK